MIKYILAWVCVIVLIGMFTINNIRRKMVRYYAQKLKDMNEGNIE